MKRVKRKMRRRQKMEGILIEVLIIHFSAREYLTRILLQDDDKE